MNELLRRMLFLPPQGSDYARQVDSLHYFVIITTMLAAAGVFATAICLRWVRLSGIPSGRRGRPLAPRSTCNRGRPQSRVRVRGRSGSAPRHLSPIPACQQARICRRTKH